MKKYLVLFACALLFFCAFKPQDCSAKPKPTIYGHYNHTMTGLNPGSNVNFPGLIYQMKLVYQESVSVKDSEGNTKFNKDQFNSQGFITQHIFQYTYKNTLDWLGNARVHTNINIPLSHIDISGYSSKHMAGVGDITFNPIILSWHNFDRVQFMLSTAVVLPSGDSEEGFGKDFWSYRLAGGFTYWFDKEKEWTLSSLFRVETNTRQKYTEIVPGTECSVDWSVSKKINKNWELGLVGSSLVQVESDKGAATLNADGSRRFAKDSVHNIGAQLAYYNLEKKYSLSLAYHRDYNAKGRPEVWNVMTAFTYFF